MFYALRRRLELLPKSSSSAIITRALTEEIQRFCEHECAHFTAEVPLEPIQHQDSDNMRKGIVDVFIRTKDNRVFAIEIDRANKRWSLDKLLHCSRRYNAVPIWIRWRGSITRNLPASVVVADIAERFVTVINDHVLQHEFPGKIKKTSSLDKAYSVADIRKTYPNAYKPWTEADDIKLICLHREGVGFIELAQQFGRKVGAISSRIKHLEEVT